MSETEPTAKGIAVREKPTEQLMDEFLELQDEIEWVRDELQFRFNHERFLEGRDQKNNVAKLLNEYEDKHS